ncbi:hypothetical protein niasHS_002357 [Heterodera schachtii]|uniref:Axin n=1 Tax=Heterodera schachtii TaxID=97005 RepID=A0ABD2KJR6_HETSC
MDIGNSENKCRNWAVRLEEVLNDFDALQCFQSWLGVDDDSTEHPLRLHFAIIAFREMSASGDARSFQLAKEIFTRFLLPRVGLCDFIGASIRERIGQRLKREQADEDLFDECLAPLDTFLRRQHAIFVQSQEFLDFFNEFCFRNQQKPSTSADEQTMPMLSSPLPATIWHQNSIRRSRRRDSAGKAPQPLTADSLLRSQWEREAIIPAGGAGLFKPVSKFPYMGQTNASKKDSAVSSSFSSEANRRGVAAGANVPGGVGTHSMRQLREGQRRANQQQKTHLLSAFPKPDVFLRENSAGMPPNCHETAQGRREFAEKLAQKLRHVELQHKQDESVNRQIDRINSARQRDTKTSTRELIIAGVAADPLLLDATAADDADDDVENYFRRRMMDSSSNNSAQQSPPPLILSARKTRRKSRGSCSPTAEDNRTGPTAEQQRQCSQVGDMPLSSAELGTSRPGMSQPGMSQSGMSQPGMSRTGMSQSCYQPSLNQQQHFDLQFAPPQNGVQKVPPLAPCQLRSPFAALPGMPSSSSPRLPPSSHHHNSVPPPPHSSALSQSVHLAGPSAFPAPALPKKSSPVNPTKQMTSVYCDNDGDTSGIGSMTTTHSGNSARGDNDRQRAAMFRRARELSSGGRSERSGANQQQGLTRTARRELQQMTDGNGKPSGHSPQLTNAPALSFGRPLQQIASPSSKVPKMPISFRDTSGDGVLVVAHVPQRPLTFREFRHYLSISSKDRRQFFFKSSCEDGSAPYQLLLISDDAALLPLFEGKVSAECRAPLSDSD